MPPPVATALDYLWQVQRLLPRGRVWHRGWGTAQAADLLTLMPTWARLHGRLNDLIPEIFPCSTVELLPEWEATLGLPDPCIGELNTIPQRQAAVCAKFAARGGQSVEYFIAVAAALGFEITITQFSPFRAGWNRAGQPLCGEDWAHAWRVNVSNTVVTWFRAGFSTAGQPLASWANTMLECVLAHYAPAHTIILWSYILPPSIWDGGASIWDGGASIWDAPEDAGAYSVWDDKHSVWDSSGTVWDLIG